MTREKLRLILITQPLGNPHKLVAILVGGQFNSGVVTVDHGVYVHQHERFILQFGQKSHRYIAPQIIH